MPLLIALLLTLLVTGAFGQVNTTTTISSPGTQSIALKPSLSKTQLDNLFILGKYWGFLKYHHPAIAKGKYNWDKELIDFITSYSTVKSKQERNDSLLAWITRLGDVPRCDTCRDSSFNKVALRPDLSWINPAVFSKKLSEQLMYVHTNRARGDQYYIRFMSDAGIHLASFEHENAYTSMTYPAAEYRLLALFRYWNIIEYWYPYKYNLGQSWDAVLKKYIPLILAAGNAQEYAATLQQLIATIQDGHAVVQSKTITAANGNYYMPITIKFIEGKALVVDITNDTLAQRSGIAKGDIIESIDGLTIKQLIDKKRPVISASNHGSMLHNLQYLLVRSPKDSSELVVRRNNQVKQLTSYNFLSKGRYPGKPGTFSYERDSALSRIEDSIGYINLGNLQRKDSLRLRALVGSVKGLIIDNRQYPKTPTSGELIGNLILPPNQEFVKFSYPYPEYPGLFPFSQPTGMGTEGTTHYFPGKIAILINEETQSSTEFQAMVFRKAPGAALIGSHTAGADGNVALINLPGGIYTYISGLGIYYPDGKETQRIGIVPDIEVKPTIKGFLNNKDELLMKAMEYVK